MKIATE